MLLSNKTSELFDASKQGVMDSLSNYNYTEQPYNYARKYIQRFVIMYQQYLMELNSFSITTVWVSVNNNCTVITIMDKRQNLRAINLCAELRI